jgi:DNA-binding SARP family transcriptional activator
MQLKLLGTFEFALGGVTIEPPRTSKARSMLAYLALRRAETIRRQVLMTEFWPDADPTSARNNLKTTLSTIRRTFREAGVDADAVVQVTRDWVRWDAPAIVDVHDFERCSIDDDDERRKALALYRGDVFPGDVSEWVQELRRCLAIRFEEMLRRELTVAPAAAIAERLLALDPFSDEAYVSLVEAALRSGNCRSAQAVYRRYAAALQEIGVEPPHDLAIRVGMRQSTPIANTAPAARSFFGRTDELAEIEQRFFEGSPVVLLSGVFGIGKSMLAFEALRRIGGNPLAVVDIDEHDLREGCRTLREHLKQHDRAIWCASPAVANSVCAAFSQVTEIEIGPLAYDEVALAIRRSLTTDDAALVDAVWKRSKGYALVLEALVSPLQNFLLSAEAVERSRLPRELERRFEAELRFCGADVAELATFLALEKRLDNDDLAALLDWNLARVIEARERLTALGVAQSFCTEAALRTLSPSRREHAIGRIAARLELHEDPSTKMRSAELLNELGRAREAGQAYLEAGRTFATSSSWGNAAHAIDAGIACLEPIITSIKTQELLRELHLEKGHILYQQGAFVPALRSLEAVLDISDPREHGTVRSKALLSMGHALVSADMLPSASNVAKQAVEESVCWGDVHAELGAQLLLSRVLRDPLSYDEKLDIAERGYKRSIEARQWSMATSFANAIVDVSRRLLNFEACFLWAQRQLEAAILAGPLLEAESRHMIGSVKVVVHRIDEALAEFRHALPLVEQYRHRHSASPTPAGQLEWMMHHALAHTYITAGLIGQAIGESEWLVRSPWMLNTPFSVWQATSVSVDARLAAGSARDVNVAKVLLERLPQALSSDTRACLDILARARVSARLGDRNAPALLHMAFESLTAAAVGHPDQIHPYFYRLAESARGVDDFLSARALDIARTYEHRLIEQAGHLWGRSA